MDKKQNSQAKTPAANTKNPAQKPAAPSQPNKNQPAKKSNW